MMIHPHERPLAPTFQRTTGVSASQLPRRHNVSRACVRCQQKKTKCFGGIPCQRCLEAKSPCVVDEINDERRKIMVKRRIDTLEKDRLLLTELVDTLRDEDRRQVSDTMNLIRSDASIDEIRSFVTGIQPDTDLAFEKPKPGCDVDGDLQAPHHTPSARRNRLNIQRLSDNPPHRVPARPWTSVTYDSDFVSHLISLYFSWEHQALSWIDQDTFLSAMKSGNPESEFCSPFLVNALLAVACWFSDWPEAMATQGDPTSKGLLFFNEAQNLLSKEEGKVSLTNVQGLGALYTSSCMMGKDRLGWKYLVEIGDSTRQLLEKRARFTDKIGRRRDDARAFDFTLLGLSNLTSTAAMMLQQPAVMQKPELEPPPVDHGQDWAPYPLPMDSVPGHTDCVMHALLGLQEIVSGISTSFFGKRPRYDEVEVMVNSFYRHLKQWSLHVPECIGLGNKSTPGVMDMHMKYHATVATIFGFIKPVPESDQPGISIDNARYLRHSAAQQIRDVLASHRYQWTTNWMPMNYAQYATVALFSLLDGLDDEKNTDAFVDLCIILCALSRRWLLAKGTLRLVHLTAQLQDIILPVQTRSLFVEFGSQSWKRRDRNRFSSLYPNFAATVHGVKNLGEVELDVFLDKWDDLDFSDIETEET